MDQAPGKRDDGRNSGYGSRAERPVGAPEGSVFERIGADGSKNLRRERADPGTCGRLHHKRGTHSRADGVQAKLSGSKLPDIKVKAIASLREAAATMTAKAPEDAPAFKAWLRQIAQKAAEASTEGGFLGFGGVQVSEAEKATLAEISTALGIAA